MTMVDDGQMENAPMGRDPQVADYERPDKAREEPQAIQLRGSGGHLVTRWRLEADGTRYDAIIVEHIEGIEDEAFALVCVSIAGGQLRRPTMLDSHDRWPKWPISGGGAWYELSMDPASLSVDYVAEKFLLPGVDAIHTTTLLRAALER